MAPSSVRTSALLTDLYQLNMMQAYLDAGMDKPSTFEFFARRLPRTRNFLVAAGLEQLLDYLETISFSEEELAWLEQSLGFKKSFLEYLREFRFTGDVYAMPEGTIFFADEPCVQVVAPLPQAQLVESRLINLIHFQTVIASKAARVVLVARDKLLVDFGMRRAHGSEAAQLAARASFLAGFSGTSNVLAGKEFGIPVYGTMAHSYIEAHRNEQEAFEDYSRSLRQNITFLLDTYNTEAGAQIAVELIPKLQQQGIELRGVRIDSGDLAGHARQVRKILNDAGHPELKIFASGGLDERDIRGFVASGAPIDGYGVGTKLTTSSDSPALDTAYKLEEYDGSPKRKTSEGKATWPGRKQVYRSYDSNGRYAFDTLALEQERLSGRPLLMPVMLGGKRVAPSPELNQIRDSVLEEYSSLSEYLKATEPCIAYPVQISVHLQALAQEVDRENRQQRLNPEGLPPSAPSR